MGSETLQQATRSQGPIGQVRDQWRSARRSLNRWREGRAERRLGIETRADYLHALEPNARNEPYDTLSYEALALYSRRLALKGADTVYDIGCGKGRLLCYFAQQPVRSLVGVELDPALARVARDNAAAMKGRKTPITVLTADATTQSYADASVVLMNNPFGAEVMRAVLAKLCDRPGPLRIFYSAPRQLAVFDEFPMFRKVDDFYLPYDLGRTRVVAFSMG